MPLNRFVATVLLGVAAALFAWNDVRADEAPAFIEGQVISGDRAPEAGVWVIAETDALPTPYRKIVVTGDDGRFLLPDLPDAEYQLWARG